jgi:hypothetical protein
MNLIKILTGSQFQLLIKEGDKVNKFIKNGRELFPKETYHNNKNKNTFSCPQQSSFTNPLPFGILFVLLALPIAWWGGTIISYFELSVQVSAVLFLAILPFMGIYAALMAFKVGRGYGSGLKLIQYLFLSNLFLTLVGCLLMIIKSAELNEWMRRLNIFPLQLIIIFLCRKIMNSKSFSKLMSFFYSTRMNLEAKMINETLNKRIK